MMLKNYERVLKMYFRYLFRYLLSKFLGAEECYKVQKSAFKRYKMLSSALKNPKSFLHVAVVKNISNVVANKNSSFKSNKRSKPKSNSFNNFNKIIITFDITIVIVIVKCIKNHIFKFK